MQFGPQWAGGQAETATHMAGAVRALRPASGRANPPTPPHLLARQRSAVSIGTEKAHCSSLTETQMAMRIGTAAIVVDAHIRSQMAEWKSSQVYRFSYLRNAHSALCAQDCSGNRREQRMRQSPHYLLEAYILVEEAGIPTSQPKNQWY